MRRHKWNYIKKRSVALAVASILMASCALSGCSGDSSSKESESGSSAETSGINTTLTPDTQGDPTIAPTENPEETLTEPTSEESDAKGQGDYTIADGYTPCWQIVKSTTDLNIRKGASAQTESIGLLKAGDQIQRISIDPSWSQVVIGGEVYYAGTQYLEVVTDQATLGTDPVLAASSQGTVTPPTEETTSTQTPDETNPSEETPSQSESVPPTETLTPTTSPSVPTTFDRDALLALDNTTIPYGYAKADRDADNIPLGIAYYERLYGNYAADFIAPKTNQIYLTMDEGYEAGYTPELLDIMKEKNVKVVFFVTKQFVTENPQLVQRMIDEGHIIGNHTCAHPSDGMPSLGLDKEKEDIMWLHEYVKQNFNYEMKLFRYPTGAFSIQSLALVNSLGYHPVFWSYAHADWSLDNQPDEPTALQDNLDQLHPGAIYLLHAVSSTNTHNMRAFIDGARAKGYEFGVYPENGF